MIERPHTLADIATDISNSSSRIFTSEVYSVRGIQHKRRNEIACAVNGQGISIYDIRQSKLLTTYAVSPQSKFTCSPRCLYLRDDTQPTTHRAIYCSTTYPKPRLQLFIESQSAQFGAVSEAKSFSVDLEPGCAPVVALETWEVVEEESRSHSRFVLAIHEDGALDCFSKQLERRIWSSRAALAEKQRTKLAALTTLGQARKGLLKSREDVVASLNTNTEEEAVPLLILVNQAMSSEKTKKSCLTSLQIYVIGRPDLESRLDGTRSSKSLQKIMQLDLPQPREISNKNAEFTLYVTSGLLHQRTATSVVTYTLSSLLPEVAHRIRQSNDCFESLVRLNSHTLAISTSSSISLIALPYCSTQAEHVLGNDLQKEGEHADGRSLRLLSYHTSLNLLVALYGTTLLTFKLDALGADVSRKRKRGNPIIDSIGQGSRKQRRYSANGNMKYQDLDSIGSLTSLKQDGKWTEMKAQMDKNLVVGDADAFVDSVITVQAAENQLPDSSGTDLMLYLFDKIFTMKIGESGRPGHRLEQQILAIRFLPPRLFEWLLRRGLFTLEQAEVTLKQNGSLQETDKLLYTSFTDALINWDSSLNCLKQLLLSSTPISHRMLISILPRIVERWAQPESSHPPKLLTASVTTINGDMPDHASSASPDRMIDASALLQLILDLLAQYPQSLITNALQGSLSKTHLTSLVNILRMEIARSGWLSPYEKEESSSVSSSQFFNSALAAPDPASLRAIVHLLGSVLDSLGAAGWISASDSLTADLSESADTLTYMRAEISAALEGIEEAVYLSGMLEEVLLCGKDHLPAPEKSEGQNPESARQLTLTSKLTNGSSKEITDGSPSLNDTIIETKENIPNVTATAVAPLPIGLKLPQNNIPLNKVSAGGGVSRRSKRDIGQLKSRQVGRYSFERIII